MLGNPLSHFFAPAREIFGCDKRDALRVKSRNRSACEYWDWLETVTFATSGTARNSLLIIVLSHIE